MNFIDIILIIIIAILVIAGIGMLFMGISEQEVGTGIGMFFVLIVVASLFLIPFIVLDKGSGSTIGTITSVDKNFFGTTGLYIKTSETTQEKYCIEFNEELETKAKELIGKEVKVTYGERVGLYSTGKCSEAPIESIELKINNEKDL